VGRLGRRFRLYKFRTLPVATLADAGYRWVAPPTDAWGRFLRSTGLDELPQFFNVLRGEMSLVGPRPERPHFVEQFRRQLPFYSTRHRFQVGITGWAQVNGWRGDTSIPRRVEHDLYYLRHWSLALDFRILWMTLSDFFRRLWVAAAAMRTAPPCGAPSGLGTRRSEKVTNARPV
jgi:lipopolysaccharide/colanic/teichoic acid biosynthesis glycosyltransferase